MEDFNKRLSYLFDKYSLTASTFSDKIGVQRSSLSHILSGRNKPSLDFILKIYEAFPDINLPWLTLGEGSFSKSEFDHSSTPTTDETIKRIIAHDPSLNHDDLEMDFESTSLFPLDDNLPSDDLLKNEESEINLSNSKNESSKKKEETFTNTVTFPNPKVLADSEIDQVMIFYKDGTFKTFRQR